jgi:hypothetical protein
LHLGEGVGKFWESDSESEFEDLGDAELPSGSPAPPLSTPPVVAPIGVVARAATFDTSRGYATPACAAAGAVAGYTVSATTPVQDAMEIDVERAAATRKALAGGDLWGLPVADMDGSGRAGSRGETDRLP